MRSLFLELCCLPCTFTLAMYFGDKKKYGLLSNHFFQRKQEHGAWIELQDYNKLLESNFFQLSRRIKNIYQSKQYQ